MPDFGDFTGIVDSCRSQARAPVQYRRMLESLHHRQVECRHNMAKSGRRPARRGAEVTQRKFLRATEQLFRRNGYAATTIRDIARKAAVNLGTLQHYWGSKPAVFRELFERSFRPLRDEFLERLEGIAAAAGDGGRPDPVAVLGALVDASFLSTGGAGTRASMAQRRELFGRALTDPSPVVIREMNRLYEAPMVLFIDLLKRACPGMAEPELDWRINCVIGVNLFSLVQGPRMRHFFGSAAQVPDEVAARWILEFLLRGFVNGSEPVRRPRAAPRSRQDRARGLQDRSPARR
jgi:AcrR family transcriptional regulator